MTLIVVLAGWLTAGMAALVMFALGASLGRRRGYEEGFNAGRAAGYADGLRQGRSDAEHGLRVEYVLPDTAEEQSREQ